MNKQQYLKAMHNIYDEVYRQYGDKEIYSFNEGIEIMEVFHEFFPIAFKIDKATYETCQPKIIGKAASIIRQDMSIDELLFGLSIVALKSTGIVNRFFSLRIILWSLSGPLQISPEKIESR